MFTKAKHKTHEMITQTQKDDSSCFDDVMQLQALPDIAHSGLSAVALDVKNSTEYVRIHPVCSHSVSVVTRAHNARSYDVNHGCTSTFTRLRLIAAVNMQISQTATTLAVVFELFSTKQEKLIEIGFFCTACIPVWSLVKHLRNKIRSLDSRFLATRHTATSKVVHQTPFHREDAAERGLATPDYLTTTTTLKAGHN